MKPVRLLFLLCLVLFPLTSHAQGGFAAWGGSPSNGAPTEQAFDCQSNTGAHSLIVSLLAPVDMPAVSSFSLDLIAIVGTPGACDPWCPGSCVPPDLPAYWDLSASGCRARSLSAEAGFPDDPGTTAVGNPFAGALLVQHPWVMETRQAGCWGSPVNYVAGHVVVEGALPMGEGAVLQANHEYYVTTLNFNDAHSAGSGACEGCCTPVTLFGTLSVDDGAGQPYRLPIAPAFWQGFAAASCVPVATRNRTWGSLKSLYR